MIKVDLEKIPRVCQGDIIKNADYVESVFERDGVITLKTITYPLIVILSQDCDLQQEYMYRAEGNNDKWLLSVLAAPLYNVEHVYSGEHLKDLGLQMSPINRKKTPGQLLRQNKLPRYHYIEFPTSTQIVPSVIDFKHYFSINTEYITNIKGTNFICSISPLFRENLSHRFSYFLSRIGLPEF